MSFRALYHTMLSSSYCTAKSGETRFHAKRLKEGLAKYTDFIKQRVAFKGRIFTNIYARSPFHGICPLIQDTANREGLLCEKS